MTKMMTLSGVRCCATARQSGRASTGVTTICPFTLRPLRTNASYVAEAKYGLGFSTVTKTSVAPERDGTPPRTTIVFELRTRVMNGRPRPVTHELCSVRKSVGGSSCTVHGLPGFDGSTRTSTHPSCIENADTGASYQFTSWFSGHVGWMYSVDRKSTRLNSSHRT